MLLTLEVVDPPSDLQADARKEFDEAGGTIGRHAENTWVLPGVTVSGEHAKVAFHDGVFSLEDTSMNGVFVSSTQERLVPGRPRPLASGDALVIGPFEIRVGVVSDEAAHESVDTASIADGHEVQSVSVAAPSAQPVAVPAPSAEPISILSPSGQAGQSAPPHPTAVTTPPDDGLATVLREIGLGDLAATPELGRVFGEILRVVVIGVMDLLHARQQFKAEFRMDQTLLRPRDNNPLKFSLDADEALRGLLECPSEGYLGSIAAFEDAFNSLRKHHVAALVGMRAAFDATLDEFDPEQLKQEFDRTMTKSPRLKLLAKRRYWELYREKAEGMAADPDTTFRALFGDTYTDAYEEQVEKP